MKTKKTNKVSAVKMLAQANKEVKTISGAIKIVTAFWSKGYKDAFETLGLKKADIEYKNIVSICQKNENNSIYLTVNKIKKSESGQIIMDKEGKPIKENVQDVVKVWTPNKLYRVLQQSMNSNK